jgi:hypothetical protein
MKKDRNELIPHFRITQEVLQQIEYYCAKHGIKNKSEFYRFAISLALKPDVEDPELVFSSLKQVHDTLHTIERQQEILFSFIGFLGRYFLTYHAEIPEELKYAAGTSAIQRYEKLFTKFQESLKNSPSMFESLLADFFEDD